MRRRREISAENDEMRLNCFVFVFVSFFLDIWKLFDERKENHMLWMNKIVRLWSFIIDTSCAPDIWNDCSLASSSANSDIRSECSYIQIKWKKIRDFSASFSRRRFFWIWQCDRIIFTRMNCTFQFQLFFPMILQFFDLICKLKMTRSGGFVRLSLTI